MRFWSLPSGRLPAARRQAAPRRPPVRKSPPPTPPLSPAQAAELYEGFLRDTLDMARAVPQVERLIYYAPAEAAGYFEALAPDFGLTPQAGGRVGGGGGDVSGPLFSTGVRRG